MKLIFKKLTIILPLIVAMTVWGSKLSTLIMGLSIGGMVLARVSRSKVANCDLNT